ncbi:hypothetical protein [Azoarcus sp. KH32C]|uniref:hypothetical protein n=1 Tax=Azoarcus sp. KH32C TaxID=748247 RepID=UPI0002385ED1|nr:hypothetical protein [Azoarcus sp. KH32C]BAL24497.1 hypothetical protein AZKH_2186 [Azoarcus sp. KH32C]
MATIVIKDLPENMDLDRQAMQAITGGARLRGRPGVTVRALPRDLRIAPQAAKRPPVMSTLFK